MGIWCVQTSYFNKSRITFKQSNRSHNLKSFSIMISRLIKSRYRIEYCNYLILYFWSFFAFCSPLFLTIIYITNIDFDFLILFYFCFFPFLKTIYIRNSLRYEFNHFESNLYSLRGINIISNRYAWCIKLDDCHLRWRSVTSLGTYYSSFTGRWQKLELALENIVSCKRSNKLFSDWNVCPNAFELEEFVNWISLNFAGTCKLHNLYIMYVYN